MTPDQALQLLSEATQPQTTGKISREGYVQIQAALDVIKAALHPAPEAKE